MSILIADVHPLARRGMRVMVGSRLGRTVHEVDRLEDVIPAIREHRPSLLVMDMMEDVGAACALIREIRSTGGPPVLVVTAACNGSAVMQVLNAGAAGFLNKARSPEEYRLAIHRLLEGETFLCPCAEKVLIEHAQESTTQVDVLVQQLSDNERQVLGDIAAGFSTAEIAGRVKRSERWVEAQRAALRQKFGSPTRAELVQLALRAGCLKPTTATPAGKPLRPS